MNWWGGPDRNERGVALPLALRGTGEKKEDDSDDEGVEDAVDPR